MKAIFQSERVAETPSNIGPGPTILPRTNDLLAVLTESDRRRLAGFAELTLLRRGTVLYEIGDELRYAYFPVNGMISLNAMTPDGTLVQVAAVERDGLIGVPTLIDDGITPYRTAVLLSCEAFRLNATSLSHEFKTNAVFQAAILKFAHRQATQIAEAAVCHYFHTIAQRLCRWLLVCADCARSETIELTQDSLAQMLGVPRQSISRAATKLQDQALIQQRHGRVRLLNRSGLVACACECYGSIRNITADPLRK